MGLISRGVTLVAAVAGLGTLSQAPEFAQQYRQRVGGAVDELRAVVQDFDRDAGNSGMSRTEALEQMLRSNEQFPRDRGTSMNRTMERYEALAEQETAMDKAHPVTRPLFVLRYPDTEIIENAWEDFQPALPFTIAGLVYGGLGAFLAMLLARTGISSTRAVRKRRADRKLAKAAEAGKKAVNRQSAVAESGQTAVGTSSQSNGNREKPGLLSELAEPPGFDKFGYRPRDRV